MDEYELLGGLHEIIDADVDKKIQEWIENHDVNYWLVYPLIMIELGAMNEEPQTTMNLLKRCVTSFVYAKALKMEKKFYLKRINIPGLRRYIREYENVLDNEDYQFFFNTKDLCMIEYIPEIFESGITSLKIEGRMKTAYYVATTVRAYRMAIDAYYKDPENWKFDPMWLDELKKGSHRDFSTGFFLDRPGKNSNNYESASYIRNYDFIGIVRDVLDDGYIIVEQRNKMSVNDDIEVIGPYKETMFTTILEMYNEDGEPIESAPHARQIVKMKLGIEVDKNYILRKPIIKG